MPLYTADLETLSTPVNSAPTEPIKIGKKKKKDVESTMPTPEESPEPTPTPKEKKPLTEKQKAALAKMQETRKRKREEKLKAETDAAEQEAIAAKEKEIAEKEKELKKAEQAEKRKKRRLEKKAAKGDEIDQAVDEAAGDEPVVKTIKQARNADEPPKWFKKYIEGVANEQNALKKEKQPRVEIKRQSEEVAQKSWQDGHTRDRVQTEVDAHMDRMYQMMFSRKLK